MHIASKIGSFCYQQFVYQSTERDGWKILFRINFNCKANDLSDKFNYNNNN